MDLNALIGAEATHMPLHIVFIRLGIAAALGAAIGFERGGQSTAGLRTHVLIAVAAALFTTLSLEMHLDARRDGSASSDPIRAIEAVTAGIAFLGAGAIFRRSGGVSGLTTGAGMWLAGAVGVSAALGYYVIAVVVAVFALAVLALLKAVSHEGAAPAPKAE